jgi:hypothetical protein
MIGAAQASATFLKFRLREVAPMGLMPRLKAGFGSSLHLIAKRLRDDGEDVAHEPLPRRWVDLIHYLDEEEGKGERRQAETEPRGRRHRSN